MIEGYFNIEKWSSPIMLQRALKDNTPEHLHFATVTGHSVGGQWYGYEI